jgi:RNA polymerase sigma factor (sigma-70 family)
MTCARRSLEKRRRARRELPCADLDRVDAKSGLWTADEDQGALGRLDLRDEVRRAVATALTAKQREVVEAHFFEGLSQGDIARRLGISQQVVQKRIYGDERGGRVVGGAIRKLREVLLPLLSARPGLTGISAKTLL